MTDYTIPRANAPISGNDAPSTQWYNFLRYLDTRTSSANGDVQAEITTIAEKLGSPDGNVDNIPPLGNVSSVQGFDSIVSSGLTIVQLRLANDVLSASPGSFYGSDSTGMKGWQLVYDAFADTSNIAKSEDSGIVSFDLTDITDSGTGTLLATTFDAKGRRTGSKPATITGTAGRITVANGDASDGLPTIDLATVTDAGGGALQRTAFDAYGRKIGTSAATTSDLAEGSNLYFTDERAQDAVGAALDGTGDVPLSYDDAGNTISAALSAGVLASLTRADSATQPGDLATVASSGAYTDLSGLPTLGTAAALDAPASGDAGPTEVVLGNDSRLGGGGGSGNVVGPASAVDGDLALFDGITGKLIKSGGALDKAAVGLGNVDNTSDMNKPVSTAQQAAMDALSLKNRLINGDFAINQRAFAGGALAAGVYGFDRWKAGTGGCNVSLSGGVLTHTSGPLVQVMEAPGLASTTVTVSVEDPSGSISVDVDGVTGTITSGSGRRGVSIAVPSGSTGNVTLKLTATGVTYKRVQLEVGSVSTAWDTRSKTSELMQCFRYYWRGVPNGSGINTNTYASAYQSFIIAFHVRMRAIPAASGTGITVGGGFDPTYSTVGYSLAPSVDGCRLLMHSTGASVNANAVWDQNAITSYFEMDAEL